MTLVKIKGFIVCTRLLKGMDQSSTPRDDEFPATQAGLALAQDARDYRLLGVGGSFGEGAGVSLLAEVDDEEGETALVSIGNIPECILDALPMGKLVKSDWQWMAETVWNGQNRVRFEPSRAKALWAKLQFAPKKQTENTPAS